MFAKIIDGAVVQYPYTLADFHTDNPGVMVRRDWTEAQPPGIHPVVNTAPPPVSVGQVAEETNPVFVDGEWQQSWVVRNRTAQELADAKAALRAQVNALRDEKQSTTMPTNQGALDCDTDSRNKLNGAVLMAMLAVQNSQPFALSWTMADNTQLSLDAAGAITLGQEVGSYIAAVHGHAVALKTAIDGATSFAELAAIDIDAGWPS